MLQLHLNDQQFYCLLWIVLYWRFDGTSCLMTAILEHKADSVIKNCKICCLEEVLSNCISGRTPIYANIMTPIFANLFTCNFVSEKYLYLDEHLTAHVLESSLDNKTVLAQVMAWYLQGARWYHPLSKPTVPDISDAIWCHLIGMNLNTIFKM